MARRSELGIALVGLATSACTTWHAPSEAELARIRAGHRPTTDVLSITSEVTIDSERLRGTFEGVLVSDPAGRIRVQLFPDLGGKILDLVADEDAIVGSIPQAEIRVEGNPREGNLPRHLLTFFAITLLEAAVPLHPDRVVDVRTEGAHLWVRVRPRVAGSEVEIAIDAEGRVIAREYRFRHVGWCERPGSVTEVVGAGFRLVARERERLPLAPDEAEAAFARRP